MLRQSTPAYCTTASNDAPGLADVIAGIGTSRFGPLVLSLLHRLSGADHCAMFRIGEDTLSTVATASLDGSDTAGKAASAYVGKQHWRRDPTLLQARRHVRTMAPLVVRVDVGNQLSPALRRAIYPHVRERVLICTGGTDAAMGLSVMGPKLLAQIRKPTFAGRPNLN